MVLIENLSSDTKANVHMTPDFDEIIKSARPEKKKRMQELYKMFYKRGPGNGSFLALPFDQMYEHGPGHIFSAETSGDTRAVIDLANKGDFSALVLHVGQAEAYGNLLKKDVPLIIKVDGHQSIGSKVNHPSHANLSSVKRAVKAGANAIGFTLYVGGENFEADVARAAKIVEEAHDYNLPVFMWAYARGPLANEMQADSLYWCLHGIAVAEELGVDVVKQKYPMPVNKDHWKAYKKNLEKGGYYQKITKSVYEILKLEPLFTKKELTYEDHVKRLNLMNRLAPLTLKIISGGPAEGPEGDEVLLETTRQIMDSGMAGRIVGRKLWTVPVTEALKLTEKIVNIMKEGKYHKKNPKF